MYVTTFYSYKGGVGRTMALVNFAVLLAKAGKRVLVVDFDLEAPGLPSFDIMECARGRRGIVDYVEEYRRALVAPSVEDFLVQCELEDSSIWLMPAGDNTAAGYTDRLNAVDWEQLYERESGYLMFEDMKQQWAAYDGRGFDYVLIDSRTGHTDVGGICTRQLPNAVVVLFVPNSQNVDGLGPIVHGIRAESKRRQSGIQLHFCPSNVPEEYDENGILARLLSAARSKLEYGDDVGLEPPVTIIHHHTSLELLEQPLVALQRPTSRLATEYEGLRTAVISRNLEDRDGALVALGRLSGVYEAARNAGRGSLIADVLSEAFEIRRLHPDDGEIALQASGIFNLLGDFEQEVACLTTAICGGHRPARARLMRAVSFMNRGRRDEAQEDLKSVLSSNDATRFEFVPAVQLLRMLLDDPAPAARELFLRPETRLRAKLLLAPLLMTTASDLAVVAEEMMRVSSADGIDPERASDALSTASLALIGAGRFQEALETALPARETSIEDQGMAPIFNRAIAEWGSTGQPPLDLFARLDEEIATHPDEDANVHQCFALIRAVMDNPEEALRELDRSGEKILPSTPTFDCRTYRYVTAEQLSQSLAKMREEIVAGQLPAPTIISEAPSER